VGDSAPHHPQVRSLSRLRFDRTGVAARLVDDTTRSRFLHDALLGLLGTALVASCDEWHQTYLPNRNRVSAGLLLDLHRGHHACNCWSISTCASSGPSG